MGADLEWWEPLPYHGGALDLRFMSSVSCNFHFPIDPNRATKTKTQPSHTISTSYLHVRTSDHSQAVQFLGPDGGWFEPMTRRKNFTSVGQ